MSSPWNRRTGSVVLQSLTEIWNDKALLRAVVRKE